MINVHVQYYVDDFEQDKNDDYIKPADYYNCVSCNKIGYIYVHDRRKYEIYVWNT